MRCKLGNGEASKFIVVKSDTLGFGEREHVIRVDD